MNYIAVPKDARVPEDAEFYHSGNFHKKGGEEYSMYFDGVWKESKNVTNSYMKDTGIKVCKVYINENT